MIGTKPHSLAQTHSTQHHFFFVIQIYPDTDYYMTTT